MKKNTIITLLPYDQTAICKNIRNAVFPSGVKKQGCLTLKLPKLVQRWVQVHTDRNLKTLLLETALQKQQIEFDRLNFYCEDL